MKPAFVGDEVGRNIDLKDDETGTVTVLNTAAQLLIAASAVGTACNCFGGGETGASGDTNTCCKRMRSSCYYR
jgi:hypothetical protein